MNSHRSGNRPSKAPPKTSIVWQAIRVLAITRSARSYSRLRTLASPLANSLNQDEAVGRQISTLRRGHPIATSAARPPDLQTLSPSCREVRCYLDRLCNLYAILFICKKQESSSLAYWVLQRLWQRFRPEHTRIQSHQNWVWQQQDSMWFGLFKKALRTMARKR